MPRLHELATGKAFNHYDALFYGRGWSFDVPRTVKVFGKDNIGNSQLTSMQVTNDQLASDQTSYITNWYARTNIPMCAPLERWSHTALATMKIGDKPVAQLCMADLLARKQGDPLAVDAPKVQAQLEALAQHLRSIPLPLSEEQAFTAANHARKFLMPPAVLIVPVRQLFHIEVAVDPISARTLIDALLASGDRSLEAEPVPALWIHVEGFSRRDVC